ncbi:MAG: M48 family metallopeptidase [Gemmatimonadota bacterium]
MSLRRVLPSLLAAATAALVGGCVTISPEQEVAMGRDYADQINAELPLLEEPAIRGTIQTLGREIADHTPRADLDYEFQVPNTDVVNAFAVPGGFVYVNRGLIEASENMTEVAGVLGHEIGHVVARHSVKQLEQLQRANLGLALGTVVLGAPTGVTAAAINITGNLYFAKHSRTAEAEADSLAVFFLIDSGWDPRGLVTFFDKLIRTRESRPGALEALFTSHPLAEDRIENIERIISRIPPERLAGLRTSEPAYDRMTDALAALPPPPAKYRVNE